MGILQEFKEFAVKGNMLDMAVGIIIGAEFGKIVNSMVQDIIMPPIGILIGNIDFKNLFFILKGPENTNFETLAEAQKAGAVTLNLGHFITTFISFAVIAFCVFLLVKGINRLRSGKVS